MVWRRASPQGARRAPARRGGSGPRTGRAGEGAARPGRRTAAQHGERSGGGVARPGGNAPEPGSPARVKPDEVNACHNLPVSTSQRASTGTCRWLVPVPGS
ncbi:hypothetical protein GCM10010428_68740 [Actinosynnema pretiosum subsp. pretiosum]